LDWNTNQHSFAAYLPYPIYTINPLHRVVVAFSDVMLAKAQVFCSRSTNLVIPQAVDTTTASRAFSLREYVDIAVPPLYERSLRTIFLLVAGLRPVKDVLYLRELGHLLAPSPFTGSRASCDAEFLCLLVCAGRQLSESFGYVV